MNNIQEWNLGQYIFQSKESELRKSSFPLSLEMASLDKIEPLSVSTQDLANPLLVSEVDYPANEVIVKYEPWVVEPINLIDSSSIDGEIRIKETTKLLNFELWELDGISVEEAISLYSQDPNIQYIEPNYQISLQQQIPNDPYFSSLWGLHNTGQLGGTVDADIDAPEAWDIQTGNGDVIIGVIDTGVDYTHPDLVNNIWTNPGEIANNGIDDDGNGYIDDFYGWDFAYDDADPMDVYGHGTHVSGTIAAQGDNNNGVVGVNWDAQIMALKFLNDYGSGNTFDAVQAIEYATLMGADLTNNSWGGGGYSQALYDAIAASGEAGQLFIAAAGNYGNNNDIYPFYPASYDLDNIISVAATDRYDNLSYFSHYGETSVDLGAPGSDIYSTIPGNGYASYNGTSMATPHVSGVAALLWAEYPDLTAAEVKQLLLETTDPIAALDGKTVSGGRLNAYNALVGGIAATIEGSQWNDQNQNGLWDAEEPTLAEWTVYLDINNNGELDVDEPSTTTDEEGNYVFNFVQPGTYTVAQVLEPGWTQTYPSNPGTYQVEVEAEEVVSDLNFGNFLSNPAEIQGSKWHDVDGDGIWDSNESALEGWTIYLDQNENGELDEGEISTITDANGHYSFTGLAPDTYTVAEVMQLGWGQTYPSGGRLLFDDPPGDTFGYYDALDIKSLSGSVSGGYLTLTMEFFTPIAPPSSYDYYNAVVGYWDLDVDQNTATGVPSNQSYFAPPDQQGGPLGVDVYVDLFSEEYQPGLVNLVDTTTYSTIATVPITYNIDSLQIEIPLSVLDDDGSINYGTVVGSFYEPTDAAPNPEFGTTLSQVHIVEVGPDEVATDINFGNRLNTIQGSTWNDLNGNGIWDADEVGLADWAIYLDDNQNGQLDNGETYTFTDADGHYSFSGLAPGTYTIGEFLKPGWDQTYPGFNGGFETGQFLNWQTLGDTTIETASFGAGPTEGIYQALLTNGVDSVTDTQLENFLGLTSGSLDSLGNGYATQGSVIKQTLTVKEGTELSFDWNFLTNEGTPTYYNDFAFITISSLDTSTETTLANTYNAFTFSSTPFYEETGFGTFSYTFATTGRFTIGIGLVDVGDTVVDSGLLVDNFRVIGNFSSTGATQEVTLSSGQIVDNVNFGNQATIINGTNQQDTLIGTIKNEILYGDNGKDHLYGMEGNDELNGGNAHDILVGVDPNAVNPGLGEFDSLNGGNGPDTFVLGDANQVYYDDNNPLTEGLSDYALIADFAEPDQIQLHGTANDYDLVDNYTLGTTTGTAIFREDSVEELIGLVADVTGLDLNSNDFSFVS
ncbi:MAG: S8 family serine peptidase [Crocosphaera sp.]|nr:S8 family serine peptidase [Crocosphaera sp.]